MDYSGWFAWGYLLRGGFGYWTQLKNLEITPPSPPPPPLPGIWAIKRFFFFAFYVLMKNFNFVPWWGVSHPIPILFAKLDTTKLAFVNDQKCDETIH